MLLFGFVSVCCGSVKGGALC